MTSPETIGVDLGGTKMLVGVVDSEQHVHHRSKVPSGGLDTDELLDLIVAQVTGALEARPDARAAGLGIPCTIDRERGVAVSAVNLPIVDVPIRDLLDERLPIPFFIDNDANCAAIGEHRFGAARGSDNAVVLTIGTGVGGGLILGGEVYRGSIGAGAELGHVVIDENGPPCQGNCPNRGCVETFASGTAIAREGLVAAARHPESALAEAAADEEVEGREVTEAARAGDAVAIEVLAQAGRHLGVAFSSLANVFDPDLFVIGGGVSAAGDLLLDPAREELRARALPPMNETPVKLAELGEEAGMIGAAAMALLELER